jgi:acetyl/propionyl-CoA carboxylase alpha subunit
MSWLEVELGGRKVRVAVARDGNGVWVGWDGLSCLVGVQERSDRAVPETTERELRAPMTGRVVKVAASAGAAVRAGQILVILEAMKMEYRIVAPRDATVDAVGCKEGDRVDLGHVVVTLSS